MHLHTDVDEAQQVIASLFSIYNCRVLADKSLLFKSPNAGMCGRGREIDFPRQFHIGQTAIRLQDTQESYIYFVQCFLL
jgi:hypothetical protein